MLPPFDVMPLVAALDAVIELRSSCRVEGDRLADDIDERVIPFRDALVTGDLELLDLLELVARASDVTGGNRGSAATGTAT